MHLLDLLILAGTGAAAYGGWRLGLAARILAWCGAVAGLLLGSLLVPTVATRFGGDHPDTRVTAVVLFLLLAASLGQAAGLAVGSRVRRHDAGPPRLTRTDRIAGAAFGVVGVLVLVWMLSPSLAAAPGWPASAARGSAVIRVVDEIAPDQPARLAAWSRWVAAAPAVLPHLAEPPDPGPPPTAGLSAAADGPARDASVRIVGRACRRVVEGSGFVAEADYVVTNAHVVAGEEGTEVETAAGDRHPARVVAFDPDRDLAVLHVPGLGATALPRRDARDGERGAVYGYPGGGPLRAAPARVGDRIEAVGSDIYRASESRRQVLVLAAELERGDSGGALVGEDGAVIGVAFAVDPARRTTAYALTIGELDAVLGPVVATRATTPVGVGPCLTGG